MDTLPANNVAPDIDALLNLRNIVFARKQRILQSWQSQRPQEDTTEAQSAADDENIRSLPESHGIDFKGGEWDDESPENDLFQPRNPTAKEKLLEQLLGAKAARAKRKQDAQHQGMVKLPQPKQLADRSRNVPKKQDEDSDEDEEGGRAAAFKSRVKPNNSQPVDDLVTATNDDLNEGLDGDAVTNRPSSKGKGKQYQSDSASDTESRPVKRKSGSYLDEVLAQRSNKKKRKKQAG